MSDLLPFVCTVCAKDSKRGHFVRVRLGQAKGQIQRVCRNADCIIAAAIGENEPAKQTRELPRSRVK